MKFQCYFILLLLFFYPIASQSQESVWNDKKENMMQLKSMKEKNKKSTFKQWKEHINEWGTDKNYNHAMALGAQLNTNGWSGALYYLKAMENNKKTLWQIKFSEIRHDKEIKIQNQGTSFTELGKNTSFILGKVNNVYTLQLGYGREQIILPALLNGNLSVYLRYAAGPAVVLMKPYYLNLIYVDYLPEKESRIQREKYEISNADKFLTPGFILGGAAWSKGIKEIRLIPGVFAEAAISMEPDKPKSFITAISIGGNASFYSKSIEIMAERKAYPYQLSLFAAIAIGKRWK